MSKLLHLILGKNVDVFLLSRLEFQTIHNLTNEIKLSILRRYFVNFPHKCVDNTLSGDKRSWTACSVFHSNHNDMNVYVFIYYFRQDQFCLFS